MCCYSSHAGLILKPHPHVGEFVPYLEVLRDEDLAGLFDHGLGLELFSGELAFPGVEHLLAGDAGQRQVGRVGHVTHGNLDRVWVDGAGGVPGSGGQDWGGEEEGERLAADWGGEGL